MTKKTDHKVSKAKPRRDAKVQKADKKTKNKRPKEIGGPKGPEPTRYGDWERKGIISDF